jgi:methylphosphotriester-DNA--protein-cysteine methyltransferase
MHDLIKRLYGVRDSFIITSPDLIGMDSSYMGRLFKKAKGSTPSTYRQQHQN